MIDRLTEIEARLEAASSVGESFVSYGMSAELIANAPADLRYLLERVREANAILREFYAEGSYEFVTTTAPEAFLQQEIRSLIADLRAALTKGESHD